MHKTHTLTALAEALWRYKHKMERDRQPKNRRHGDLGPGNGGGTAARQATATQVQGEGHAASNCRGAAMLCCAGHRVKRLACASNCQEGEKGGPD
jgi:hypothetical protein